MSKVFSQCIIALSIFCLSTMAIAESVFNVELIFFKRIKDQDSYNFLALEDEQEQPEIISNFSIKPLGRLPKAYQALARKELKLQGVFRRLRSSPSMRPLFHIGWRQPLSDKEKTPWLTFNLSDTPEQQGLLHFKGMFRFSRNQGLLVENIVLGSKPAPEAPVFSLIENEQSSDSTQEINDAENQQNPDSINTDASLTLIDEQMPDQLAGEFLLSENRKIKLNQLHYFDHPGMGILIKVTAHRAALEEQQQLE